MRYVVPDTQCVLKMHFAIASKKRKLSEFLLRSLLVNAIPRTVHCYLLKLDRIFFVFFSSLRHLHQDRKLKKTFHDNFRSPSKPFMTVPTFYDLSPDCHDKQAQKAGKISSHCPLKNFLEISL